MCWDLGQVQTTRNEQVVEDAPSGVVEPYGVGQRERNSPKVSAVLYRDGQMCQLNPGRFCLLYLSNINISL